MPVVSLCSYSLLWCILVCILAMTAGGLFAGGLVISVAVAPLLGKPISVTAVFAILCASLLIPSVIIYRLARSERLSPQTMLSLGLGYVVLAALGAVAEIFLLVNQDTIRAGLSGICIWIAIFPLIMPCLPRQALATGTACALITALLFGRAALC